MKVGKAAITDISDILSLNRECPICGYSRITLLRKEERLIGFNCRACKLRVQYAGINEKTGKPSFRVTQCIIKGGNAGEVWYRQKDVDVRFKSPLIVKGEYCVFYDPVRGYL